jgi:TP901 family phage tail tape measure protein
MSVGAIRAGQAFVEILTDTSKLEKGLNAARANLQSFASYVESAGKKMMFAGIAATYVIGRGVQTFAEFEDRMRSVQAVAEISSDTLKKLYETGRNVGTDMGYRPVESASAMIELAKAGFSSDEIEGATRAVLALSRATGEDLIRTTTNAAQTLRVFHLEASQMAEVSDLMTVAANQSTATVEGLDESLKYAAPIAAQYGLTLKDTLKAIAVMASAGVKGSMAGTSMRQILLQLSDAEKQAKLLAIGVQVVDQSTGKLRNFGDVMIDIGEAMKGMSQSARLSFAKELFDQRAVSGALNIITTDFRGLSQAMDEASGTAERQAKLMQTSLLGRWRQLRAEIDNMQITLGEGLMGSLLAVGQAIKGAVAWLDRFMKAHQTLTNAIVWTAVVLVPLGVLMTGIGLIARAVAASIVGWSVAMTVLKVALTGLSADLARTHTMMEVLAVSAHRAQMAIMALVAAITAHPIVAILTAVAAVILAIGAYAAFSSKPVAELSDRLKKIGTEDRQKQSEDRTGAGRLQTLSEKTSALTGEEMKQASGIIKTLENRYGKLGIVLDTVNKKVVIGANSWSLLAKGMNDRRIDKLNDQIAEGRDNLNKLQDEMDAQIRGHRVTGENKFTGAGRSILTQLGVIDEAPDELKTKIAELAAKRDQIAKELQDAVKERDDLVKGTQGANPTQWVPDPNLLSQEELDWEEKLVKARIEGVNDVHRRKIMLLEEEYRKEEDKILKNDELSDKVKDAVLERIQKTKEAEIQRLVEDHDRELATEQIRNAGEVEDIRLGMIEERHARSLALLDAEHKRELALANAIADPTEKAMAISQEKIRYDAKWMALQNEIARDAVRAAEELEDIKLGMIENTHEREIALIEAKYKRELELANKLDPVSKKRVEDQAKARRDAKVLAAETQRNRDIDKRNKDRQYRIDENRIRLTIRNQKAQMLALNELEKKRALEEAKKNGEDLKKVEEEYDQKRRLIMLQSSGGPNTRGLFSPFGAGQALGSQSMRLWERMMIATERTAKNTDKLAGGKPQGVVVGP